MESLQILFLVKVVMLSQPAFNKNLGFGQTPIPPVWTKSQLLPKSNKNVLYLQIIRQMFPNLTTRRLGQYKSDSFWQK